MPVPTGAAAVSSKARIDPEIRALITLPWRLGRLGLRICFAIMLVPVPDRDANRQRYWRRRETPGTELETSCCCGS